MTTPTPNPSAYSHALNRSLTPVAFDASELLEIKRNQQRFTIQMELLKKMHTGQIEFHHTQAMALFQCFYPTVRDSRLDDFQKITNTSSTAYHHHISQKNSLSGVLYSLFQEWASLLWDCPTTDHYVSEHLKKQLESEKKEIEQEEKKAEHEKLSMLTERGHREKITQKAEQLNFLAHSPPNPKRFSSLRAWIDKTIETVALFSPYLDPLTHYRLARYTTHFLLNFQKTGLIGGERLVEDVNGLCQWLSQLKAQLKIEQTPGFTRNPQDSLFHLSACVMYDLNQTLSNSAHSFKATDHFLNYFSLNKSGTELLSVEHHYYVIDFLISAFIDMYPVNTSTLSGASSKAVPHWGANHLLNAQSPDAQTSQELGLSDQLFHLFHSFQALTYHVYQKYAAFIDQKTQISYKIDAKHPTNPLVSLLNHQATMTQKLDKKLLTVAPHYKENPDLLHYVQTQFPARTYDYELVLKKINLLHQLYPTYFSKCQIFLSQYQKSQSHFLKPLFEHLFEFTRQHFTQTHFTRSLTIGINNASLLVNEHQKELSLQKTNDDLWDCFSRDLVQCEKLYAYLFPKRNLFLLRSELLGEIEKTIKTYERNNIYCPKGAVKEKVMSEMIGRSLRFMKNLPLAEQTKFKTKLYTLTSIPRSRSSDIDYMNYLDSFFQKIKFEEITPTPQTHLSKKNNFKI